MSLGRLLESAEGQRNTASYDSVEFFSRRLLESDELDVHVREILEVTPSVGQRPIEGSLRQRGLEIHCHPI